MVDVWFLNHCRHGLLHRPISEFEVSVLIPDALEIKERPAKVLLDEPHAASVGHSCCGDLEL